MIIVLWSTENNIYPGNSTVHISELPNELLTKILTIGCDLSPSSDTKRFPDYDEGYYRPISHPRRLKPFVGIASFVCRQWYDVTHSKGNYHFWVTALDLRASSGGSGPPIDRQLYYFKRDLDSSQDSDIDLFLGLNDVYSDSVFGRSHEPVVLNLLLHGINMIRPHIGRIRILQAVCEASMDLDFLFAALKEADSLPRLCSLYICCFPGGGILTTRSSRQSPAHAEKFDL